MQNNFSGNSGLNQLTNNFDPKFGLNNFIMCVHSLPLPEQGINSGFDCVVHCVRNSRTVSCAILFKSWKRTQVEDKNSILFGRIFFLWSLLRSGWVIRLQLTWNDERYSKQTLHRLQYKSTQGNVFTRVCHSVKRGSAIPQCLGQADPIFRHTPPRSQTPSTS